MLWKWGRGVAWLNAFRNGEFQVLLWYIMYFCIIFRPLIKILLRNSLCVNSIGLQNCVYQVSKFLL
jgi:hypothetical protein